MTYVFALVAGLLVAAPAFGQNSKPSFTIEMSKSAARHRAPAPTRAPARQKSKLASKHATIPATPTQPVASEQIVASSTTATTTERQRSEKTTRQEQDGSEQFVASGSTAKTVERQRSEEITRQEQDGNDWISYILIVYSLPAFVAYLRKHPQRRLVGVINLFLGWTFLGWVVALAWATTTFRPVEDAIGRRLRGETRTA